MDPGALGSLRKAISGEVRDHLEARAAASRDESPVHGVADAVVRPSDPDDLVALVRWARAHRVPLTARGGGTSLEGESVPVEGGVVVEFHGWSSIGTPHATERTVRVGPGVVNHELQVALRPTGWFYPPNPGSWRSCTIGGNIATNASGPRSFLYGPTRRWVHGLEAVLGTGERVVLGPTSTKRSVGPEMLDLLVGSEGTLGFVTSATLRLAPLPERRAGIAVPVPEGASLARVVTSLAGPPWARLSAMEYVDARVAGALAERPHAGIPGSAALVLLELESDDEASETRALESLDRRLRAAGLSEAATVVPDADRLWSLRGDAGAALAERVGPSVREDVVVPVPRLDELLHRLDQLAQSLGVRWHLYGHLGQGNLHPAFEIDPRTPAGEKARTAILDLARSLGGSVSGEHGVGALKRSYVTAELGEPAVRLLREWKRSCDPDGILNPGKLLP